jgi:hypothetical protein
MEHNINAAGGGRPALEGRIRGAQIARLPRGPRVVAVQREVARNTAFAQVMDDLMAENPANPAIPVPREIRTVNEDLQTGRINTRVRFGRKQQWTDEQSMEYIKVLLKRSFQVDPVAISRKMKVDGTIEDRAINGNNRLRTIRKFMNNDIYILIESDDSVNHCVFYDRIPDALPNHIRTKAQVLPLTLRNRFSSTQILFNIREGLTEEQEREWYHLLNTNIKPHTDGHLLISTLCDDTNRVVNELLRAFSQLKSRVEAEPEDTDDECIGVYLENISGIELDPNDPVDKKDYVVLSVTSIFNQLWNGNAYEKGFGGETFNPEDLRRNARILREIFENVVLSEDLLAEFAGAVPMKPGLKRFWSPQYLLAPMAWSIVNRPRQEVLDTWIPFLTNYRAGRIDQTYFEPIRSSPAHYGDKTKNYETAWGLVRAWRPV